MLLSPHVHLEQLPSRPCGHLGPSGPSPAAQGSLLCTSPITPPCETPTAVDPMRPLGLEGLLPTHSSLQALPALAPSWPQAHPPLRAGGTSLARALPYSACTPSFDPPTRGSRPAPWSCPNTLAEGSAVPASSPRHAQPGPPPPTWAAPSPRLLAAPLPYPLPRSFYNINTMSSCPD